MKSNKPRYKVSFVSAIMLALMMNASIVLGGTIKVPDDYATIKAAAIGFI
jgi:hypothetical protein